MRQNRGPWYLFTGLILGLAAGLAYAWLFQPVQYVDAAPQALAAEAKDQYRALIALAYQADGNLGRARQRLALLNDSSPAQALAQQAQQSQATPALSAEARALAALAEAYNPRPTESGPRATDTPSPSPNAGSPTAGAPSPTRPAASPTASPTLDPALAIRTATLPPSATPRPSPTITATLPVSATPRPTLTPSPTMGASFVLKDKQKVCDPAFPGLLQVEALNSAGQPVSGVQIRVTWPPNNRDAFYTGLMLDFGPGYADFQMEPKVTYAVQAGEGGETVTGLATQDCRAADDGGSFVGGWKVRFIQP